MYLTWMDGDNNIDDRYFAACVVQSWPYTHPLNIAWMSENTGSVGKRTIASGAVIGFANIYGSKCVEPTFFMRLLTVIILTFNTK